MPDMSGAADLGRSLGPEPQPKAPQVTLEQARQEYSGLDGSQLDRYAELVRLRQANAKSEQELARIQGAQLSPWEATKLLFLAFLEYIWPEGEPDSAAQRLQVDLIFQQKLQGVWKQAGRQAAQQRLAQGSQLPPELARHLMAERMPPGLRNPNGLG